MATRALGLVLPAKDAKVADGHVRRALPRRELRRVGPFVFCDHFGTDAPATGAASAMDVPAHPHVGLETVTYLFAGTIEHTDSVGSVQRIEPGAVNWMTAGRGIVHAEEVIGTVAPHGVQTWVALPQAERARDPGFQHVPASALPIVSRGGVRVRVLAGRLGDAASPVRAFTSLTYLDIDAPDGGALALDVDAGHQLAIYVATGAITIGGIAVPAGTLAQFTDGGDALAFDTAPGTRAIVLGGESMPEPLVIYWNFVVDTVEAGRAAEARWQAGGFDGIPPR